MSFDLPLGGPTLSDEETEIISVLAPFQGIVNIHPVSMASYFSCLSDAGWNGAESIEKLTATVKKLEKSGWLKPTEPGFSEYIYTSCPLARHWLISQLNNTSVDSILLKGFRAYYQKVSESLLSAVVNPGEDFKNMGNKLIELEESNFLFALQISLRQGESFIHPYTVLATAAFESNDIEECLSLSQAVLESFGKFIPAGDSQHLESELLGVIDMVGRAIALMGDKKQAKSIFLDILHRYQENKLFQVFPAGLGEIFRMLGDICRDLGEMRDSKVYYERATEAFDGLSDNKSIASVYQSLGRYYYDLEDYDNAERLLEMALKGFKKLKALQSQARTLQLLAGLYYQSGEFERSRGSYEKCLEISLVDNDAYLKAKALQGLGILASADGHFSRSLKYYKSALEVFLSMRGDFSFDVAQLYYNMGNDCYNLEYYQDSKTYYYRALNTYKELGNLEKEAEILQNLANVYYYLNAFEESHNSDLEALRLFVELDKKKNIAEIVHNAKNLAQELERPEWLKAVLGLLTSRYKEPD